MKRKICCFAGRSKIFRINKTKENLLKEIERLITKENVTEFWVGNYGDFDRLCAEAVRELKLKYPNITLCLVLPYISRYTNDHFQELRQNYDEIEIAVVSLKTPKKFYKITCNQYMVDMSEYIICCIRHSYGGARLTYNYAKTKKHINIISI